MAPGNGPLKRGESRTGPDGQMRPSAAVPALLCNRIDMTDIAERKISVMMLADESCRVENRVIRMDIRAEPCS